MKPTDYLATARDLVASRSGRPREANLRRAVSTTYYALFHTIATCGADTLVGGPNSQRSDRAWTQVYRALQHGPAKSRCDAQAMMRRFPDSIQDFADRFVDMQFKRHEADYNPDARFNRDEVLQDVDDAERSIRGFLAAPRLDRCAFAVYLLMPLRTS